MVKKDNAAVRISNRDRSAAFLFDAGRALGPARSVLARSGSLWQWLSSIVCVVGNTLAGSVVGQIYLGNVAVVVDVFGLTVCVIGFLHERSSFHEWCKVSG